MWRRITVPRTVPMGIDQLMRTSLATRQMTAGGGAHKGRRRAASGASVRLLGCLLGAEAVADVDQAPPPGGSPGRGCREGGARAVRISRCAGGRRRVSRRGGRQGSASGRLGALRAVVGLDAGG